MPHATAPRTPETRPSGGATSRVRGVGSIGALAGLAFLAVTSRVPAQEDDLGRGFKPYLKVVDQQYLPPEKAGGKQLLRLKFDLDPALPVGTKIEMKLQYTGLTMDEKTFELDTPRRKGVVFDWRPEKPLGPDEYSLFTAIWPRQQTEEVRKAIEDNEERFPPDLTPWAWSYLRKEQLIQVGTEEELAELQERVCRTYEGFISDLIENMNEYVEVMDEVKEGKRFVEGETLQTEAFGKFLKDWQKKQGKIQKAILDLQTTNPAIHQRSLKAHLYLMNLGRMVSRRAFKLQEEVEEKYGVSRTRIPVDPDDESDKVLRFFDRRWRYKTDAEALNGQLDKIYSLVCAEPEPEEPPKEETGSGPGEGSGEEPDAGDGEPGEDASEPEPEGGR